MNSQDTPVSLGVQDLNITNSGEKISILMINVDKKTLERAKNQNTDVYTDTAHNPDGIGWTEPVNGRFVKQSKKTDYDGAIIGILTVVCILLSITLSWFIYQAYQPSYPVQTPIQEVQ